MGTRYIRVDPLLGSASTTRFINVLTAPATLVTLTSGYQALTLFNVGSGTLLWGDSNIAVNSGTQLFVASPKSWDGLQDSWTVYVRAESVSTIVSITEYSV